MRVLVQRPLAFAILVFGAVLGGRVFAQADSGSARGAGAAAEEPDEITVIGEKSLGEYRLELERSRDEIFRIYNEANKGSAADITCRAEQPTGSRMRQSVCRSEAENRADADAARGFLGSLLRSAGNYITNTCCAPPGTQVAANIGTGEAQDAGQTGEADALAKFEQEWKRLLRENQDLYKAVVTYVA